MRNFSAILSLILLTGSAVFADVPTYLNENASTEARIEDALTRMSLDDKIAMCHAQSKFSTPGCPKLGIPELWFSDGPHGVRMEFDWDDWTHAGWTNDSCTAMPALTCLAATFNPELAGLYGNVVGEEARFRKKDVLLGPGVNIYRTPMSGRNFEYMGEDPFLSSTMVVPYINGVQRNGVAACLKHFALNNQEKDRDHINVIVSERALNEIYLPPFKAGVVKGKVWAVMGSYNKYKGSFCSHNDTLINDILKRQWAFDGVMITDWGSAHDTYEAALNGLDIEMGSWTNGLTWGISSAYDNYFLAQPLKREILAGNISETVLDEKIRRILRLNFRTNMNRNRPYGSFQTKAHAEVAQKVAEEGIVLLKNEKSTLPIAPDKFQTIAVIGENAVKKLSIGGGSSELKPKVEQSPLEGIRAVYGGKVKFALGYASGEPNYSNELPSPYSADSLRTAAVELAKNADVVLFFGGLNKNYSQDCEGDDRKFYHLPFGQDRLIEELSRANPNIVVVLISGNAVEMPWIDKIPAVIQSWYLGSYAGISTANIISGAVNPSGKLPFSIPKRLSDCPAHYFGEESYPGVNGHVHYKEDLLVGYRWYDTKRIDPLFAFGHGLSYTDFKYTAFSSDKKAYTPTDTIRLKATIANCGNVDGAETIQIYVGQERPSLYRPAKELKGFKKVFLKAGEEKTIEIAVPVAELAFYDDTRKRWIVETDSFKIHAASSSDNIRKSLKIKIKNK